MIWWLQVQYLGFSCRSGTDGRLRLLLRPGPCGRPSPRPPALLLRLTIETGASPIWKCYDITVRDMSFRNRLD